ncbi:hypothetical protein ABPG73_000153 [Tetrahymena malaccensis]
MKQLIYILILLNLYYCSSLHGRTQMSDWNIVATAKNSDECNKQLAGSNLDYCCFNSQVQIQNSQDSQGNYFLFQTQNGQGTTAGCQKLQKLLAYSNSNVQSPQILFQWGDNQQILQKVNLLVNETTVVENGITKYKFILQVPANIVNNSTDQKFLQTLEYEEEQTPQQIITPSQS